MSQRFQIIGLSCPGSVDLGVPIAASHSGAIGVLDLSFLTDLALIPELMTKFAQSAGVNRGVRISSSQLTVLNIPSDLNVVVLSNEDGIDLRPLVVPLKVTNRTVLLEATSLETAQLGEQAGVDGIIAKGHESGGWVGEESTFVLLQRLLHAVKLPVWAQGGIGLHSCAACYAAGAAGVILDSQLALTEESSINAELAGLLQRMDGSETTCLGAQLGAACRVYCRGERQLARHLCELAETLDGANPADMANWRRSIRKQAENGPTGLWLIGQEAAFAAPLAARYGSVRGVIEGFRTAIGDHVHISKTINSIGPDSPLAQSHGTRYPIVQGPMTRVSDTAEFAYEVAKEGALPLLALALMGADEASSLLEQTRSLLGERSWGVGILGFVPVGVRAEQIKVVRKYRPSFALIAGGRPDQCGELEREGIHTYLHVPSPTLLSSYYQDGARRFVLEGRECGGHVGPRSSFTLWNSAVDVLLECLPHKTTDCHVLFAGGIHDALSASMVSVLAAPLVQRGVRVGVLLGTAYLFTREVVTSGAVVPAFQEQVLACTATKLLESGPGHAIRCVNTPYTDFFGQEKRQLRRAGGDADQIRDALEKLNLGRLRIASKGLRRADSSGEPRNLVNVAPEQQKNEGMYMVGQVAALRQEVCTIQKLHEDVSAGAWNRLQQLPEDHKPAQPPRRESRGVAIIGMSCLLPKAQNLETFWQNILDKVDAVTEVPLKRWDWRQYFSEDMKAPDKVYSRWGGFLDEVVFDPLRYGMPPSNIPATEPLQLLTLEAVRHAIEDAGYGDRPFPRERTSVILGVGGGSADLGLQYAFRAALPMFSETVQTSAMASLPEWTENSFPGILLSVVAGRVANRFDLGGVNYTVDGACASSLAAVYQSVRELETGTSDLVITGGADTLQSPFAYLCFSKTNALSPRGRCRTFDESADGIAISEGLVILVLKRFSEAERDGDRIYAVIKGVAGSSDGKDKGLTAPRRQGQVLALERAYAQAGISPSQVALVEAHGTGTVVGDRVEIEALTEVYEQAGSSPRSCAVGSVKSNIGHTKSTAGAAGLAKAALALHHKLLPPTIGVSKPNKVLTDESPFYVNTEARPWIASVQGTPRRAVVSAFGFGGTNFHAVMEEYTDGENAASEEGSGARWPCELFMFTGDSRRELAARVRSLHDALSRGANPKLVDLAYTLWRTADLAQANSEQPKLAIVASSLSDLRQRLSICRELSDDGPENGTGEAQGIYSSNHQTPNGDKLAFLFPGQGSQYPDMLSELALHFFEVRREFEAADRALAGRFDRPLSRYVFPPARFNAEEDGVARQALMRTDVAQPALGAAGIAVFRLLGAFGIHPDMAAGHSYGEYVALCSAGVFPEETLYHISEARGRLMLSNSPTEPVGMAAIESDRRAAYELISSIDSVWVANLNAPNQTVISGTRAAIEQVLARCEAQGVNFRTLAVSCAFHSPLIAAAGERLADELSCVAFSPPSFPVFSNSIGAPYPSNPTEMATLLSSHVVNLVDFEAEVEAMYAAGARIFVETGPRNALTSLVAQILKDRPHFVIPVDIPGRSGLLQLQNVLAQLLVRNVPVRLNRLYQNRKARELSIASLVEDTRQASLPPTSWLVNGGRAWPVSSSAQADTSNKVAAPALRAPSPGSLSATSAPASSSQPVQKVTNAAASALTAASHNGNADQVLLQFQQVMTKILDTQRDVMLAYLGSDNAVASQSGLPNLSSASPHLPLSVTGDSSSRPDGVVSVFTTPSSQPEAEDRAIGQRFLAIVSERTGYPVEALGLDQRIEADLGVDSLKTSEILAAFQQSCDRTDQTLVRKSMELLAKAKTLRAMIDLLEGVLNKQQDAGPDTTKAQSSVPEATPQNCPAPHARPISDLLPRSRLAAIEATACKHKPLAGGSFVVTDDEHGFASLLSEELRRLGMRVSLVRFGHTFAATAGDCYEADLSEPEAVTEVVRLVRERHGPLSGIVHLLPMRPGLPLDSIHSACWKTSYEENIKSMFLLARAAATDLRASASSGNAWLISATATGGGFDFHLPPDAMAPSHGGLVGMLKCLALEWSGVHCKHIDFTPGQDVSSLVHSLIYELSTDDNEVEIGYRGSQRIVFRSVEASRDEIQIAQQTIDKNSVILMTGGGRGITARFGLDLATRHKPTLLIVGRSAYPESAEDQAIAALNSPRELRTALFASTRGKMTLSEIEAECQRVEGNRELRRNLEAMREAGASVKYFSLDVRNEAAFRNLIDDLYQTYGRIDGVVHGAGVIDDKLIENKTPESFDRVFDTKVSSAFVLSRALRPESLKFLVFFSSISACFGNPGQADYAAANGVLDKLALYLDRVWPAHVFSINWGPWAETGMVSPSLEHQFNARGIDLIAPFDGVRSLDWEIRYRQKGDVGVILGRGPWVADPIVSRV